MLGVTDRMSGSNSHQDRRGDWNEAPRLLRLIMLVTERLGFPIMAFFLMFWLSVKTLGQVTDTLKNVNESLTKLNITVSALMR